MEEEPKKQTLFMNATYMGREFKAKGTTQAGKEWKKYRLTFKKDDKELHFIAFDSAKNLSTLEEGTDYSVAYNESDFIASDGSPAKSKTAFSFGAPRTEFKTVQKSAAERANMKLDSYAEPVAASKVMDTPLALNIDSPMQPVEKMVNKAYDSPLGRSLTEEDLEYHYIGFYLSMVSEAIVARAKKRFLELRPKPKEVDTMDDMHDSHDNHDEIPEEELEE